MHQSGLQMAKLLARHTGIVDGGASTHLSVTTSEPKKMNQKKREGPKMPQGHLLFLSSPPGPIVAPIWRTTKMEQPTRGDGIFHPRTVPKILTTPNNPQTQQPTFFRHSHINPIINAILLIVECFQNGGGQQWQRNFQPPTVPPP